MGEVVWCTLIIEGWPARGLEREVLTRGGQTIRDDTVGLDTTPLDELAEKIRRRSPLRQDEADALDALAGEIAHHDLDSGGSVSFDPAGTLRCPACHHEREIEAFGVSREPRAGALAQCPECGFEAPVEWYEHGKVALGFEGNYGTESIMPVLAALRACDFPYDASDEWGSLGKLRRFRPGLDRDEHVFPHVSDAGIVLTEAEWTKILNASRSLKEAANRVSDFFGWAPLTDRGVAEALNDETTGGAPRTWASS